MKLTITSNQLSLLRKLAEGEHASELQDEQLSKKQMEAQLREVYKKLKTKNPLEALQSLAKCDFVVTEK